MMLIPSTEFHSYLVNDPLFAWENLILRKSTHRYGIRLALTSVTLRFALRTLLDYADAIIKDRFVL